MLGTREVKTGVVFCKDPNLGEDVHWGPGSGEERRAPASAVQGALPPCAAVLWEGREGCASGSLIQMTVFS